MPPFKPALLRHALVLASVAALLSACAGMRQAYESDLDRSITVGSSASLADYRRVGIESVVCRGALCRNVSRPRLAAELNRGLTAACYETVSTDEMRRYAAHYGQGGQVSIGISAGGDVFELTAAATDLRVVVADELGLRGIVKTFVEIGEKDEITEFRNSVLNVQLVDALGRQTVWQANLTPTLMDDATIAEDLARLMRDLGGAIKRRAGLCDVPQRAMVASETTAGDEAIEVVDKTIRIPEKIYFELGSAKLSQRSHAVLTQLAAFLNQHREIAKVGIHGHTDSQGQANANMKLSQARAEAVKDFLVAQGVPATRLEAYGHGEQAPLAENSTIAGRAKNRRVEFVVEE